jgi:Mg-chelatase subunit ChlD
MADIVTKNKISVTKGGSLHARIAEVELRSEVAPSIVEGFVDINTLPNRLVIMIDQSGSMNGEPIKLLENAVQDFIQKSNPQDTAIAIESFPESTSIEMTNDKMKLWMLCMGLRASGGTPMVDCMNRCIKMKMTRAILISDGQPDYSPIQTARDYASREIPIDTVHIGDSEMGVDVLKEISEITGGLFVKFKDIRSFSTAFAFLLPETRAQAAQLFLTAGANEVK